MGFHIPRRWRYQGDEGRGEVKWKSNVWWYHRRVEFAEEGRILECEEVVGVWGLCKMRLSSWVFRMPWDSICLGRDYGTLAKGWSENLPVVCMSSKFEGGPVNILPNLSLTLLSQPLNSRSRTAILWIPNKGHVRINRYILPLQWDKNHKSNGIISNSF